MKSKKQAKLGGGTKTTAEAVLAPMRPDAQGFSFERNQKEEFRDGLVMQMLMNAAPMPLGTPGWMTKEAWTRTVCPYSAEQILGSRSEDESGNNLSSDLTSEYGYRMGYQFSWGSLEEDTAPADEEFDEDMYSFYICPEKALCVFPRSDLLCELMEVLYDTHPLAHKTFDTDDWGSWNTLGFIVWGEDIQEARIWMHDIFLPKILPDLLKACYAVAVEFQKHGIDAARRLLRSYGCTLERSGIDDSTEELEKMRRYNADSVQ
jgi:hypothetical protein